MDTRFYFRNGDVADDVSGFIAALEKMDEGTFAYHCNKDKNDFFNWMNDCISPKVAKKMKGIKTRKALIKKLKETL
jgi:hypothetical protein